ncbi:MAG: hypothetical protein MK179_15470 [Pirellulaceae bacterium]|nr:hypothetical protein [Pirellulaceae bacterium]
MTLRFVVFNILVLTLSVVVTDGVSVRAATKLTELPISSWCGIPGEGFDKPVTGIIYNRATAPCCGMPLGGVATGCVDIDARGVWGYSSLFNGWDDFYYFRARIPRMNPRPEPIFGLSVNGTTWALAPEEFIRGGRVGWCTEPHNPGVWTSDPKPRVKQLNTPNIVGVKSAGEVLYWGHFPICEMDYITEAPVLVKVRAFSPFFPGNAVESNIPAAVFEVRLKNRTGSQQTGSIAMNFPGPNSREARSDEFTRKEIRAKFSGTVVASRAGVSYALGTIDEPQTRLGAGLTIHEHAWSNFANQLPQPVFRSEGESHFYQTGSASAAVDFSLAGGEEKIVRFVLAWYAPVWEGAEKRHPGAQPTTTWNTPEWMGETNYFRQMYGARFVGATDVAMRMAAEHEQMLDRILAWQKVIYDSTLPGWLQHALLNNLCLIPENGYWAQPQSPLPDWTFPDGIYALNESSRGCPHLGNMPSEWYGTLSLTYLFPDLHELELRAFREYQSEEGEAPFAIGKIHGLPDCVTPEYYWQKSLNGYCYVDMVDRLWQRTGDPDIVRDYYESVKKATAYTIGLSTKPGAPIRMPDDGGMEWFEHGEWAGMATHMGGLRLAMLRMAERMAETAGDVKFADKCRTWFAEGSTAMETQLWTEEAGGYYLNFWEPETNRKSEDVMGYQLDGQWAAIYHGLPGVFKQDRVKKALATIKRCNVALTPDVGAANFCRPDGSPLSKKQIDIQETIADVTEADVAHYGTYAMFTAEVVILGMTYMQAGEPEFGLDLIRKHWETLMCRSGHPWDYPNLVNGHTGERIFGTDYGQGMMLWALPAAVEGKNIAEFSAPGGLLDRIIHAANPE